MNNLFNPKTIVISSLDGNYAFETEKVLDPYKSGPSVITMVKKRKINRKPGERLVREFNKLSKKSVPINDNEKRESKSQNTYLQRINNEDCEHNSNGRLFCDGVLCDAIENISRSLSFTKV